MGWVEHNFCYDGGRCVISGEKVEKARWIFDFKKCEKIQINLRRSEKERLNSASSSPRNNALQMYQTSYMNQILLADAFLRYVPTLPVFFFLNIISTKKARAHLAFLITHTWWHDAFWWCFFNIHDRQSYPLGTNSLWFQVRFLPNDQALRCLAHQLQHNQLRKIWIDKKQE